MFIRHIPALFALSLFAAAPAQAQDTATHNHQTELTKGMSIAIQGCVVAGEKADTFVITDLTEIPGAPIQTGRKRFYWMEAKHLRGHVGQLILVSGQIKDLERSEIEVELGAGENGGAVAKVEGPGMAEVKTTPANVEVSAAGQTQQEVDTPIVLVKIDVSDVKVVNATCVK